MKIPRLQNKQLLLWHKGYHTHPIFNPTFAKENLASLEELSIKLFLYFLILIYTLHLAVLYGLFETETLSWMIVEFCARKYMFWASDVTFMSKANAIIAIGTTILGVYVLGYVFRVYKANLHPGSTEKFKEYLKIQILAKKVNRSVTKTLPKVRKQSPYRI